MKVSESHTDRIKERLSPRNKPQQDRSKVRLQILFDAASEVIAESGLQGLVMREVARRANLPIASVYHYFPSTTALIRALLEVQREKLRSVLVAAVQIRFPKHAPDMSADQVKDLLIEQLNALIGDIADFFFNTPSAAEIWGGLQAYPELRTLDLEDAKKNAALIEGVFIRFLPSLEPGQASVMAMVLVESVSANLRLALASPPEIRAQIVTGLKSFVAQWLTGFVQAAAE
jgi:AcrR family transcriptional regulator